MSLKHNCPCDDGGNSKKQMLDAIKAVADSIEKLIDLVDGDEEANEYTALETNPFRKTNKTAHNPIDDFYYGLVEWWRDANQGEYED